VVTRGSAARLRGVHLYGLAALVLVLMLVLVCTASTAVVEERSALFAHVLEGMKQAYDRVDHYTATMLLQERVDRELGPNQRLMLKFKKPLKIYLRWLKGKHEGRQALYPAGVDGNERTTFDRPAQRYILHFPADPAKGYYCMTALIDVDREYQLPVYAEIFDWYGQLIERYGYLDVRLNPGLTDADFDPKNPAYGF
jgi:outer membrane lipoprotein-sorting protein